MARDARIRAEGPRARDLVPLDARRRDGLRRHTPLDPVDQAGHRIEAVGADAAPTVEHSRHQEQAEEVPGVGPVRRDRLLVVVDRHERGQGRVGPAEIHQELAAPVAECGEVRVGGVEEPANVARALGILVEVEGRPVVARIRLPERHVPHERFAVGELQRLTAVASDQPPVPTARRLGFAERRGARFLGADRLAGKVGLAVLDHPAVDLLQGSGLRRGDAVRRRTAGAFGQVACGVEGAAPRVVDDAVDSAALGVDNVRDELQRVQGQRPLAQRPGVPEAGDRGIDEVQHRRAGDDPVEIARESLRRDQRLPAPGRAAVPVRIGDRAIVVPRRDALRRHRRQVHRAERVVGHLLRVEGEARQRLLRRVVAGIGGGGGEAVA